ncbi:MAG: tetratricopeptide repeat protein, partial [Phycisphaerae bacterium]
TRGQDRMARAQADIEGKSPIRALAAKDFEQSSNYLAQAGNLLGNLVRAAPGFFNHGRLVYMLNMTAARNPASANMREQFLETAQTALQGELERQPFNLDLAVTWANIAAKPDNMPDIIITLARPLRYAVISPGCFDLIATLTDTAEFRDAIENLIEYGRSEAEPTDPAVVQSSRRWLAEILRISATSRFVLGDYQNAVDQLTQSTSIYNDLSNTKSIGPASAFAELAIAQFYLTPDNPKAASAHAQRAKELCPPSLDGRQLKSRVLRQEVDYALAEGKEEEAVEFLTLAAGSTLSDEIINRELAMTYLDLCEALLQRRRDGTSRMPPSTMTPKLIQWVQRSIALEPNHGPAHMQAADLELLQGNDEAAVAYLREAIRLGINQQALQQYLGIAVQRLPQSAALKTLLQELGSTTGQRATTGP